MFRSLRMRLVGSYVIAAIALVIVAAVAITAIALSVFGNVSRENAAVVARMTPEEVRIQMAGDRSLAVAAPDIVRHLARPGILIVVQAIDKGGVRRFLASGGIGTDGQLHVFKTEPSQPPFQRGVPPFALNVFLRLEPLTVNVPGGRVRVFPMPVQLERFFSTFWLWIVPVGLFVTLAAWFAGRYIANQALRPLVETTASLRRFAAGDFTPRAVVTSDRSEIGELVTAYNGAVAQVAAAFEERRSVELQMRQFVADAGHELRTPLTVIMGFVDVLRRRGADASASARIYETMSAESRRMRALIDKLIALARLENPQSRREFEDVDLAAVADDVVRALQALQPRQRVVLRADQPVTVRGDEHELHDAIKNLVDNALKYAPLSPVEVSVRLDGDRAIVEVADRGPGLSEEEQRHVFDRFYRGENRGDAEGSGLGLAIVKRVVERAGGEVTIESSPGGGARFTIALPLREEDEKIAV